MWIPERDYIAGILRHFKTHLDMALRSEMINLIRTDIIDHVSKLARISKVAIVKMQIYTSTMRVNIKMFYPFCVKCACPANQPVDLISL